MTEDSIESAARGKRWQDDYTPTTAEVRMNDIRRGGESYEVTRGQFDRWLASERAAWQAAQQSETREALARELHHFEAEQAMTEALECIQPSALMRSTEPGWIGSTRDVQRARVVLSAALGDSPERSALSAALTQAREALDDRAERGMCLSAGEGAVLALRALVAAIEEGKTDA